MTNYQTMQELMQQAAVRPVAERPTRAEKLARWAFVVRAYRGTIYIFHLLEHLHPVERRQMSVYFPEPFVSAFTLAANDPQLREMGLTENGVSLRLGDIEAFFDLSIDELHEFSCDCGGHISNHMMADRIEAIAKRRA